MLSNAYFLAKFRFDTAENEPAKNLQNFRKMHFSKMPFSKMHFSKMLFSEIYSTIARAVSSSGVIGAKRALAQSKKIGRVA